VNLFVTTDKLVFFAYLFPQRKFMSIKPSRFPGRRCGDRGRYTWFSARINV